MTDGKANLRELALYLGEPTGSAVVDRTKLLVEIVGQLCIPDRQKLLDEE